MILCVGLRRVRMSDVPRSLRMCVKDEEVSVARP